MIYQTQKRDYSFLKTIAQVLITVFAFIFLPCVAYLMSENNVRNDDISNVTCTDKGCFDKHGRKTRWA
jgi:hypothetical protein